MIRDYCFEITVSHTNSVSVKKIVEKLVWNLRCSIQREML